MTVGEVMRRQFISLAPDDPLSEAERTMRLARVRQLPVVRDDILVGMISYRDVLRSLAQRLLGPGTQTEGRSAGESPVAGVMTEPLPTVSTETSLEAAAAHLCSHETGCLAVLGPTEGGLGIVGLISESDLLRAAYERWP